MQLEDVFANVIAAHQKLMDRWYYGITLSYNNVNSLASLLELTKEQYETLLVHLELASIAKNTKKLVLKHAKWRRFLVNHSLSDTVYYEITKIKNVPTGDGVTNEGYNGYWMGVGKARKNKEDSNPSDLYKDSSIKRPRSRKQEIQKHIKELKKQINELIQNNSSEVANVMEQVSKEKKVSY